MRNKVVFVNIERKMKELGYDRDWQQCRVKTKILKKTYREVKDHNGDTGRGRKSCKFHKELDEILGHRPASAPAVLLDTGTTSKNDNTFYSQESAEEEGKYTNVITAID